jgi:hypothetical protein
LGGCAALLLAATPAASQYRVPETQTFRFVSELGNAAGIYVNPGAAGFFTATLLTGNVTFDRPEGSSWKTGQYQVGLQWGPLIGGYSHDEYHDTTGFAQGDAYTVGAGFAASGNGAGVTRTWRTVGDAESSWDAGYLFVSQVGLSLGVVWRDIGSPVVRDTVLDERVVGALSFREPQRDRFSLSLQVDYRTKESDFRAFRVGGGVKLADVVEILGQMQWDGEGNFDGFRVGLNVMGTSWMGTGVVGLESTGDVRRGHAGVSFLGQRRGI